MDEQTNDIAQELALLHSLDGGDYSRQVERIACRGEFYPLKGEESIYVCGGESAADFNNLLNAARKAMLHGYTVFILPNPKGVRTADFILKHKNVYRIYDVKSIHGRSSAGNRLIESIGQANNVILNIRTNYDARQLALKIRGYFEANANAIEVLVLKGNKKIVVDRPFLKDCC
jgi:hypothetical protein